MRRISILTKRTSALLFAAAFVLFSLAASAQPKSVYFIENFDGTAIPEGWEAITLPAQWVINTATPQAGGQANELQYSYNPNICNGITARFVSPVIDLSGILSIHLEFIYKVQNYYMNEENTVTWGIETTSNNGETWNVAFSEEIASMVNGSFSFSEDLTSPDIGSDNFRFCFFVHSTDAFPIIKNFYFDNIQLTGSVELDGNLLSIDVPHYSRVKDTEIGFTLQNLGANVINTVEAKYTVEGFEPVTQTFSDLEINESDQPKFTFDQTVFFTPGIYNIEIEILSVNGETDDISENNLLTKEIEVAISGAQGSVSIDHFTSASCGPCVGANSTMKTLLDLHPGKYNISKNQVNIPQADPYSNSDGELRRQYYNVNSAPNIFFNGNKTSYTVDNLESIFLSQYNDMAFVDIAGSWSIDGKTITINADVTSYTAIEDARIYVSVNEKKTTGNAVTPPEGSFFDTVFYHVMMKMLPDGNGTTISFDAGEITSLHFESDLSETNIEEFDDLEVNVFVQNHATQRVYNGRFLPQSATHPKAPTDLKLLYTQENIFTATWTAPDTNPLGYNLYVNGEEVETNYTGTDYSFEIDDTTHIYVFDIVAVYANNIQSIKITDFEACKIWVSAKENPYLADHVKIYPNPAKETLNIDITTQTGGVFKAVLYNMAGQQLIDKTLQNNASIDVSNLQNGVYLLKIVAPNGTVTTKKVEVM